MLSDFEKKRGGGWKSEIQRMERKLMLYHSSPSWVAGWEEMEETFVASSTGEGMEVIDMVQDEDSERLRNSAVKDMLSDLAFSFNIGNTLKRLFPYELRLEFLLQ
uniref:Uncharacterized protein n=1 Tax=Nothoprocta perdicaria TaxID=30464 RepID=A0A8C7E898_NOTPE